MLSSESDAPLALLEEILSGLPVPATEGTPDETRIPDGLLVLVTQTAEVIAARKQDDEIAKTLERLADLPDRKSVV